MERFLDGGDGVLSDILPRLDDFRPASYSSFRCDNSRDLDNKPQIRVTDYIIERRRKTGVDPGF